MVSRELWVGLFFFTGLFLMGWLTFKVDDEGHIFAKGARTAYKARFDKFAGIGEGSLVYMAGLEIGNVRKIELVPAEGRHEVEVTVSIKDEFKVREDSEITVEMITILQGQRLVISPGSPGSPVLPEGSQIKTGRSGDLMDVVAELQDVLAGLKGEGALGRSLLGAEGFKDIGEVLDTLSQDGGLGRWVLGEKDLDPTIAELRKTLENVRRGTEGQGTIARLLHDEELGGKFDSIVTDLKGTMKGVRSFADGLDKGKGTLARLAHDEELGEKLDGIMTDLRGVAGELRASKGTLWRLINDEELGQKVDDALGGLAVFAKNLSSGEGALAKLTSDPELFDEIMKLIVQARETVEDAREAAPISLFSSILFGALQ